jgi:hypothetical protein
MPVRGSWEREVDAADVDVLVAGAAVALVELDELLEPRSGSCVSSGALLPLPCDEDPELEPLLDPPFEPDDDPFDEPLDPPLEPLPPSGEANGSWY